MDEANTTVTPQTNIQENIFSEQIKILYKNLLVSVPASFICSTIILVGLYDVKTSYQLWSWFAAVSVISVFRFATYYYYHHFTNSNNFYLAMFIFGMALSAALWGVAGSILMPQDNLLEQMLVIVIIAGVTAGGIQTLNANLIACLIYVMLIVTPLCIWFFMQTEKTYIFLGIAMTTYLIFMLVTSVRGYKLLLRVLTLHYDNLALVDSLSISNQNLLKSYQLLEKHEHEIELINQMNTMLQSCDGSNETYDIIRLTAKELFVGSSGGLSILNHDTNTLEVTTQWGNNQTLIPTFNIIDCWALRKAREHAFNYPSDEVLCQHFKSQPKSSICLPLQDKNGIIGLLVLHASQNGVFTGYQLQLATGYSEVIQLALTNIKLRESLYDQSIHDPLTKLYNRRYLDEMLTRELQLAIRDKKSLCVTMIDIDHFKEFNDKNGHEAGDVVLQFISNILKEHFRETDIACRFGGEEFLLVLLNSNISGAYLRLECIREIIKESKIFYQGELLPFITISVGIAEAPLSGSTAKDIIRAADYALYSAKEGGRDRVVTFTSHQISNSTT